MAELSENHPNPGSLQLLAFNVQCTPRNNLLHQFILDHSDPNHLYNSDGYIGRILISMYNLPVNELNNEGHSPLHLAVLKNNAFIVRNLLTHLKKRIDVNVRSKCDRTSLYLASMKGCDKVDKELLKGTGILINEKNHFSCTSLHVAALNGQDKIVKLLLNVPGILINEKDEDHCVPLHLAVQNGCNEVVKELIKVLGILINEKDGYGCNPLHIAVVNKYDKIVKLLYLKNPSKYRNLCFIKCLYKILIRYYVLRIFLDGTKNLFYHRMKIIRIILN